MDRILLLQLYFAYILGRVLAQTGYPTCASSCSSQITSCGLDQSTQYAVCRCLQASCVIEDLQVAIDYIDLTCPDLQFSGLCGLTSFTTSSVESSASSLESGSSIPTTVPTVPATASVVPSDFSTPTSEVVPSPSSTLPSSSDAQQTLPTTAETSTTTLPSTLATYTRSQSISPSNSIFTATDTSAIIAYIQTGIPDDVRTESTYACFVNQQFNYYSTPTWYTALPTQVQTYYSSVNQGLTAACTLSPSEVAALSDTSTTAAPAAGVSSGSGLSTGEKAGIGVGVAGGVAAAVAVIVVAVKAGVFASLGIGGAAAALSIGSAGAAAGAAAAGTAGATGGAAAGAAGTGAAGAGASSGAANTGLGSGGAQASQALWTGQAGSQAVPANLGLGSTGAEHAWAGQAGGAEHAWTGQAGVENTWTGQAGYGAPPPAPPTGPQIPIIPLVPIPLDRRSYSDKYQPHVQSNILNPNENGRYPTPMASQMSSYSNHPQQYYHGEAQELSRSMSSNSPWEGYSNESTRNEMPGDYHLPPPPPPPQFGYEPRTGISHMQQDQYSGVVSYPTIPRRPVGLSSSSHSSIPPLPTRSTSRPHSSDFPRNQNGHGTYGHMHSAMYADMGGNPYRSNSTNSETRHESGGGQIYESGAQSVYESGANTAPPGSQYRGDDRR